MRILAALLIVTAGCAVDETLSETESAVTVGGVGTTCSTASVIGLSKQIADQVSCDDPNGLVAFSATSKVTITSNAVLPYLAKNAKADLIAAGNAGTLQVNSAFRTIAQQYLLYKWWQEGACGITAAATVGHSNHESGRAVDLANYTSRITAMANHGWSHDVPGDPVHFDHLASADIRGQDTKAFQELWNANHPDDKISVDGDYGPQTEARLKKAPAQGFAIGPSCQNRPDKADVVSVDGPDKVAPQTQVHYAIAIKNTGTDTWPATTKLVTADGMASPLHDDSWVSDTVAAKLDAPVDPNGTTMIELDVTTPAETTDTPIQQLFQLADGSDMFGEIPVALTVVLDGAGTSGESEGQDGDDGDAGKSGGCSAGGGAGWLVALALGLGLALRRRAAALVVVAACGTPAATGPDGAPGDDVDASVVDPADAATDAAPMAPAITVMRGVDRASAFSVTEAKTLKTDHGVKWSGVYIGGACDAGSGWDKAKVTSLYNATNWKFMPIWVGQQSSAICSAHTLTAAKGTADGEATVAKMKTFGWGANLDIPVALDVEGGTFSGDPSGANAYVKAWTAAVHAGGYKAYVYSSPAGVIHFHDNGTGLDGAWVASWFYSGFKDVKPEDLDQIGTRYTHHNRAWQYAGSFAVSGAGSVDGDSSDLLLAPEPGGSNL